MIIIAVGHHKNVGKDKFVTFCVDALRGQNIKKKIMRRGFADRVYEICYLVYGWAGFKTKVFYDAHPNSKNDLLLTGKTVRQTLIEVGQHFRKYDDNVWVNAALKTVEADILFLTDLRFPTEFTHCKQSQALMVRITRPGLVKPTDEADCALDGWEDQWDLTMNNDDDLNGFYIKAEVFVQEHILPRLK